MSYKLKVSIPKESAKFLFSKYYPLAEEFIRDEIRKTAWSHLGEIKQGSVTGLYLEIHWTWSI